MILFYTLAKSAGSDTGKAGANPIGRCVVSKAMEVARTAQTRPDLERRTRSEADGDNDANDIQTPPVAPADIYDMFGFRQGYSAVTTQP